MNKKASTHLHIALLFGGVSAEHRVSVTSAQSVFRSLVARPGRYGVFPIGIAKTGVWLTGPGMVELLSSAEGYGEVTEGAPQTTRVGFDPSGVLLQAGGGESVTVDAAFSLLHGPLGEDGSMQGLFEVLGLPYVGPGVAASALAMDKTLTKRMLRDAGLPQLPFIDFSLADWRADESCISDRIGAELGYPCFVKPANMGSSIGVSKVKSPDLLAAAVEAALAYDDKIVVEKAAIDCRELECAYLGNEKPRVSVVGEIKPANEFYDYAAKYGGMDSGLEIPARIPHDTSERIRQHALDACRALGIIGLSRVDFLASADATEIWLNELNTLPGFTSISMYAKLWEASGLPFDDLVDELIELALSRSLKRRNASTHHAAS